MIISCEKCNKKFELADKLMPSDGRLLQCGSCSFQWYYTPTTKIDLVDELKHEVNKRNQVDNKNQKINKKKIKKENEIKNLNIHQSFSDEIKEKKIGFFIFLLIIIISVTALVIILDTFKMQISSVIPNIDFYLVSLYDTLKDINSFFIDLLK